MIVELTENMIQDAFAKTGIDQKYYPQYEAEAKRRYKAYQEDEPDDENTPFEKSNVYGSLDDTDYYIGCYVNEREKGHGHNWAHLYALYFVLEENEEFALKDTLEDLEEDEKERELEIHANSVKDAPELIGGNIRSFRKKTQIEETIDMMFPEGIDDGFSLPED